MAGIIGYGVYVPRYRIRVETIASQWGQDGKAVVNSLKISEKSVPGLDEDSATIAVEASRIALRMSRIDPKTIGAIYVGSESHPYAVKPSATIVGDALGVGNNYTAASLEFACKAGTAGMQACLGLAESGHIKNGLAVGADCAQGRPGDALEYTAGAGGAAFVIGSGNVLAEIEAFNSYSSDCPDFWRRQHEIFPRHGARFTGVPAYFTHVVSASKGLMKKTGTEAKDYDYCVFHSPNAAFPAKAAKILGFTPEQLEPSLTVKKIGNTYSGSSMIALANVLDRCEPGNSIFMTSYGSGAGSDSFSFKVTDEIRGKNAGVSLQTDNTRKKYLDYGQYANHMNLLRGG